MKKRSAFALIEIIIIILILSIFSTIILNRNFNDNLAYQKAGLYIEQLQYKINDILYTSYMTNAPLDAKKILDLLQINERNKFFTLQCQNDYLLLKIKNKTLKLQITKRNNFYIITCNPNNIICQKMQNRIYKK